jgi:tape measure domain-containing protein
MSATFKVTLKDGVSRPAQKAARSVKGLNDDMRGVKGTASAGSRGLSALKVGLLAVGAAGAVAVAGLARVGVAVGKNIGQSAAFMEQNRLAFGLLLKGADAGGRALEEIRAIAMDLNLPIKETIKNYRKLLASQFKPQAAQDIVKLGADMQALGATSEEVGSIIRAMTQIKAKGKLQAEELTGQLAEAGVSADLVFKQLGKTMGKTTDEVRKLITAGKVDADVALDAIKKAILQKLGTEAPGEAAKAFTGTLGGMWAGVQTQAENAILNISERIGPQLKKSLASAMEFEAPPGMGKVLDDMIERFDIVQVAIEQVKAAASGWLEGFSEAWDEIGPLVDDVVEGILEFAGSEEGLTDIKNAFKSSGKVAAVALGLVVVALAAATGAVTALSSAWEGLGEGVDAIGEFFENLAGDIESGAEGIAETAGGIGTGIIDGIVEGISSGASAVVDAITNTANEAIQAAKDALDISSPSKVFEQMGRDIDRGLAGGVRAEQGLVAASTAQTVQRATQAAAGTVNHVNNRLQQGSQTFNISGAESPSATAAAVADIQLGDLATAFEQLGNSAGAAVG